MTEPHRADEPASPATAFAVAFFTELERAGVTDVVVAPGSRSQALALAAVEFERAGRLRLHVRIDERVAGFLALGLAVETDRPAVVVATSGTAIANLHPAVLEAHHSGVPLIIASADRPAELRGIRSNQTTMQPGIFAGAARLERDVTAPEGAAGEADAAAALARLAYAAAMGVDASGEPIPHPGPGPVHLNLQLREPLSSAFTLPRTDRGARDRVGDGGPSSADFGQPLPTRSLDAARSGAHSPRGPHSAGIEPGPRTVVIAGDGAGPEAEAFARAGGWPLIAEVTSGAHFGPNLVVAYRELLNEPGFGDEVERAIVFGHPTLSREVPALVQRDGVETVVVAPSGIEWFNPGHRVRRFERAVHVAPQPNRTAAQVTEQLAEQVTEQLAEQVAERAAAQRAWLGRWVQASRAVIEAGAPAEPAAVRSGVDETGHVSDFSAQRAFLEAQLARVREPVTRRMLVEQVWAASWPHDRLVLGASRLIREADRVVPGRRIRAHANRGLAGIDGTVATALGIAIASQRFPADASAPAEFAAAIDATADENALPDRSGSDAPGAPKRESPGAGGALDAALEHSHFDPPRESKREWPGAGGALDAAPEHSHFDPPRESKRESPGAGGSVDAAIEHPHFDPARASMRESPGTGGSVAGSTGADTTPPDFGAGGDLTAMLAEAAAIERTLAETRAAEASLQAVAEAESSVTRALIGDLTLLHDVGAMLLGAGETRPRLLVIVGNDGGGTIFDALEVAGSAPAAAFDRVQYTPQSVDLAALATAYGWSYLRAETRGELETALGTAVTGPTLLEVPLAR